MIRLIAKLGRPTVRTDFSAIKNGNTRINSWLRLVDQRMAGPIELRKTLAEVLARIRWLVARLAGGSAATTERFDVRF